MAKREVKKVVRRQRRPRQPVDVPMTERERELEARVTDLCETVSNQAEQLRWREEARGAHKLSSDTLEAENKRLRDQLDRISDARLEVARLEGVIQGLERAGKIDPPKADQFGTRDPVRFG